MRQRVLIAMALLCRPRLLIADEPTTALDATVRGQIMRLLGNVRSTFDTAVILVTHDAGIVAGHCDEMVVLYGGQVMEAVRSHRHSPPRITPIHAVYWMPSRGSTVTTRGCATSPGIR